MISTITMLMLTTSSLVVSGSQGHVLRNCQAWQSNRGLSKPEAIRKYVAKSEKLVVAHKEA